MIGRLFNFLLGGTLWGNAVAAGVGLTVLVTAWQIDKSLYGREQRAAGKRAGVEAQQQETGKANDKVVRNAGALRARVRDKRVRGVVDPNYID